MTLPSIGKPWIEVAWPPERADAEVVAPVRVYRLKRPRASEQQAWPGVAELMSGDASVPLDIGDVLEILATNLLQVNGEPIEGDMVDIADWLDQSIGLIELKSIWIQYVCGTSLSDQDASSSSGRYSGALASNPVAAPTAVLSDNGSETIAPDMLTTTLEGADVVLSTSRDG